VSSFARAAQRRADQARRKQGRQERRREIGNGTPTRWLFHGTAGALADSVEANGIRLGSDDRCYVTDDRATALAYATWSTGIADGLPITRTTDVGRKVATLGRYVAAVAVIRLADDHPLTGEDTFPPPLPWHDDITDGECFWSPKPIAVAGWEFYRVTELYDDANRAAVRRDADLIGTAFPRAGGGRETGPFAEAVPEPGELVTRVREESPNARSAYHGEPHWCQVAVMGQRLLRAGTPADAPTVFAFSLLHDCQRRAEGSDPKHGERAAALALALVADGLLVFDDEHLDLLCDALERHDRGQVSTDPTTGACWDADRLTLARLGIQPDPALLSTDAGRELATSAAQMLQPAGWRFAIFRYHLEAAVARTHPRR
jgi:uncharacterized protein